MTIILKKDIDGGILDIGGGGEGVIGRLYTSQVTAIDKYQEELDEAPDCFKKVLMDATELSFEDESFKNITAFYSLMYMQSAEQKQAIHEAARVLAPGGILYIWDADIFSAYPEPFCTELTICLPDQRIHTTYGVIKEDIQTAEAIKNMCTSAGLSLIAEQSSAGHFYLCFKKELF